MAKEHQSKKKISLRKSGRQRGQVAIFVALIFQVLFIFFAMLVNVGLLVHHKINLQNSADLAAYYGAMKQAEILNAIAHINYQIRQSWKLMVFRYRHIGSFGDDNYPGKNGVMGGDTDSQWSPSFCIDYSPFDFMKTGENYCRKSGKSVSFFINKLPQQTFSTGTSFILGNIGALQSIVNLINNATNTGNLSIQKSCEDTRARSYAQIITMIAAWKRDIANRKRLIYRLANDLSAPAPGDFVDLDGNSVYQGVEQTLTKNFTYQNLASYKSGQLRFFNSMAGTSRGDPLSPPAWLSDIRIWPVFSAYLASDCSQQTISYSTSTINLPQSQIPAEVLASDYGDVINQGMLKVTEPSPGDTAQRILEASSLGVEKNPWFVPYVVVHAETAPQIPFSPFGAVTLKATAYAKPFGGTIGPWWGRTWGSGNMRSDDASSNYPIVTPLRLISPNPPDVSINRYNPDTIRYVGDKYGTSSNLTMSAYAKVLGQFSPAAPLSMHFWDGLADNADDLENIGTSGDILAYQAPGMSVPVQNSVNKMRQLENAVLAPDQWDVSYYSVESDFYRNYYLRLKKREAQFGFPVRGDLGQRANDQNQVNYSVKEQMNNAQSFAASNGLDIKGALKYYAVSAGELLTSFKSMAPDNPILSPNNFGVCKTPVADSAPQVQATNGNCIVGGRVGYSVKIVDGDFLNSSGLPLGGAGTSGAIANPPPKF